MFFPRVYYKKKKRKKKISYFHISPNVGHSETRSQHLTQETNSRSLPRALTREIKLYKLLTHKSNAFQFCWLFCPL